MDTIRWQLLKAIQKVLGDIGLEGQIRPVLEVPADILHGDYATSAALQYAKALSMTPRSLAEKIDEKLASMVANIATTEIAEPGFINFRLTPDVIAASIECARSEDKWGRNETNKGKTVLMEYTDPNPFKEFHIGHLVPNAIGESISRLLEFSGAKVKRANYQGDVGVHVAKSLFILLEKNITKPTTEDLSTAYPEGSHRYEEDPKAKKAIDELNKKIYEKSDSKVNALYEKGRELSLRHFEGIYKALGTKFDFYFFESETGPKGVEIVRKHPKIFPESQGAIIFPGEKYDLHTRVFITKQGLPTYEAKELGLVVMKREKFDFDQTITITANEQADYFKVVMKAASLVFPEMEGKLAYKTHGLLRFAEGKMSSRTGNIIRGEDLIADLAERAKVRAAESRASNAEKLSEQIAIAAIKYQILKQASDKDIIFDRERALSLEGDSGPYLQYAHARAHAVVERAKEQKVKAKVDKNAKPTDLSRLLHRFPEATAYAARELEPHLFTNYLLEFASAFNHWYASEQILDGSTSSPHKVALADAARATMKNSLWLLGIPAPEKM